MAATQPSKPAQPAKPTREAPRIDDELQLSYARARYQELKSHDRVGLKSLLDRGELTAHLVDRGHSAATHRRRLAAQNAPAKDAENEVAAQWVTAASGGERPDPLPDSLAESLSDALAEYEKGEGRTFLNRSKGQ